MTNTGITSSNAADTRYTFDSDKLEDLRKRSPWKDDPKWFQSVSVSPTAIVKMVRTEHPSIIPVIYSVY
jgi:COP9 signalosome complex subunit 5